MSSARSESHIAQQSLRDKLRIQHLQEIPGTNNLDYLSVVHRQSLNPDLLHVRDVRNATMLYELPVTAACHNPSEIVNYQEGSRHNNVGASWKGIAPANSYQGCEWIMNYANCSGGNDHASCNTDVVPADQMNSFSNFQQYGKSISFCDVVSYQDQNQPIYHNTLQDIVKSANSIRVQCSDQMESLSDSYHEMRTHNIVCLDNAESLVDKNVQSFPQGNGPQGLSLSLSSNPQAKVPVIQYEDSACGLDENVCSKSMKSSNLCVIPNSSVFTKAVGKSTQDSAAGRSPSINYRGVGPLGPFTGYATILKSSRFLKPAQQLLDDFCGISDPKLVASDVPAERVLSGEVGASADIGNAIDTEVGGKGCNSGTSSPTFYSSNKTTGIGGVGSSSSESLRPEYHQKKAKLLFMEEEVCRRYKQYHQQMQMVVSSFETVAGLGSATPYISFALKSVSRHFRCLKNGISNQLRHVRKVLGKDLSASTSRTSSTKADDNVTRLKYLDQRFKSGGGNNVGFLEPNQHIWRPQRGLPEHSVAILRAWLFEHFLHPYPTDSDKHMLATQTGLSRNQVSNWFINARVRVWKPMVEEIHMLETKGSEQSNQNCSKNVGTSAIDHHSFSQTLTERPPDLHVHAILERKIECPEVVPSSGQGDGSNGEAWSQEKRSKLECQITSSMDGSLMGFVPYRRGDIGIGGLGSVSLTLGLWHGVENAAQNQQQQLQQEDRIRRHFGGQMIHDLVG